MADIQIFNNPEFGSIRSIEQNGEPWFVGKDVALALGYKDTVNALKSHVDEQDKAGWRITTQFGEKETTIINESGVYSLIFSSKQRQQGMSKTRAGRLTKMDAIAASPESVEHWLKILHEMEARYCTAAPEKE